MAEVEAVAAPTGGEAPREGGEGGDRGGEATRGGDRGGERRGFGRGGERGGRGGRGGGPGGRGGPRGDDKEWTPVTKLGRLVKHNKIKSVEEIYAHSIPIKEANIIDEIFAR